MTNPRRVGRRVMMLIGVNDLVHPTTPPSHLLYRCQSHRTISAPAMIALYKQVIRRVHARGLKIYGATVLPFGRNADWSPELEAKRKAINSWIRTGGAFDRVLDFARVVQEPGQPTRLDPRFDSGDGLHPNDAGYRKIAGSIPLSLFR